MIISIIIPVYNAEKYIENCIHSILNQTYKDFEIIIVNDGSEDRSREICENYASLNKNVKVINKSNGGSNSARLAGLELAQGKYVAFVDSDDWIGKEYLEILIKPIIEFKADISICDCTFEYQGNMDKIRTNIAPGLYDEEKLDKFQQEMFYVGNELEWGIRPTLWGKIIRKELIVEELLRIDHSIYYGEDAACVFPCCLKAKKIAVVESYEYYYCVHESSISHTLKDEVFDNICCLYRYLLEIFNDSKHRDVLKKQLVNYIYMLLDYAIVNCLGLPRINKNILGKSTLWILSEELDEKYKKIIIMGAGRVGYSYYFQLSQKENVTIVAWTDSDDSKINKQMDCKLTYLEDALNYEYDLILLAVKNEGMAVAMKEQLQSMGVDERKIMWKIPRPLRNVSICIE